MDPLTISAASGLRARLESLEMLANNLANASTAGYKSDREFYSLYAGPEASEVVPVIERHWTDQAQGTLTPTGNPLDLALSGNGFFAVNGPSGALYTRNGSFRLSTAGVLTTIDGYPVRAAGGGTIQAQGAGPLEVSPDGAVRQDGMALGQLEIDEFAQPNLVTKSGKNYFVPAAGAAPRPAAGVQVHQGQLESSNVSTPETAVRLVNLMRQFEMLQRAIMLNGEMGRKAVEEVARVT